MTKILDLAGKYAEAGLSVIPIRADGSKAPAIQSWQPFQREIAGPDELREMFSNACGIGIITGRVSGNLEVLDFDADGFYERFCRSAKNEGRQDLIPRLPIVKTPRGRHLYLRCNGGITRNQKLAQILDDRQRLKTVIETRGEGGYVLAVGSPPACHPSGKPYLLEQGDLFSVPEISAEEREFLFSIARSFHECARMELQRAPKEKAGDQEGGKPGDDFNRRATWSEILEPHGWKRASIKGEEEYWRRPEKDGPGISATLNYQGSGLLYVFSTNAQFEPNRGYSKFSAYTILNYGGNYSEASLALRCQGYGDSTDNKRHQNLAGKVREYIDGTEGIFHSYQLYAELGITDPRDKANVRQILARLKGTQIQTQGNQAGAWRVVRGELEPMNLLTAECEDLNLWLPLDLHNYVRIMPGNEIVITGDPDSGKTAFLLRTIHENLDRWDCHYFNSEMGALELRRRLELFKDFPLAHPHFHAYERSGYFEDVVRPGKYVLNVIDYLEISDEFYLVSKHLQEIHRALDGAVAIIAIQKRSKTSDLPLGAQRALEKPRLAIALSSGNKATPNRATILKCKNRKTEHSMIGKSRPFNLVSGCEFMSDSPVWD
jgi:hypothetical protein